MKKIVLLLMISFLCFGCTNNIEPAISAQTPQKSQNDIPQNNGEASINWAPYMKEVQRRIKKNWVPPKASQTTKTVVEFLVDTKGNISNPKVLVSSGNSAYDAKAIKALNESSPLRPLPSGFTGEKIAIEFTFDYNVLGSKEYAYKLAKTGSLYKAQEDYNKAVSYFTKAIKFDPENSTYYILRAYCYSDLDKFEKALKDVNTAIKLTPDSDSYAAKGLVYNKADKDDEALEAYNKAINIDTKNSVAYNGRALVYYEMQKFDKAIEDLQKSIELNPNDSDLYYVIADFYEAAGNSNKAKQARKKGEKLKYTIHQQVDSKNP